MNIMEKLEAYQTVYGTYKMVPMSNESCIKHSVPTNTCRIEVHTTCCCCGQQMKLEWLELHLQKSHNLNLEDYLDALVDEHGIVTCVDTEQKRVREEVNRDEKLAEIRNMVKGG